MQMHRRRWLRQVVLASTLLLCMSIAHLPMQTVANYNSPGIYGGQWHHESPKTDGTFVVWKQQRDVASSAYDLYGTRLIDGEVFPIFVGGYNLEDVSIDDGVVVWSASWECDTCQREVLGMNLHTREIFTVESTTTDEYSPSISGTNVAWYASDSGETHVVARDISVPLGATTVAPVVTPGDGPFVDGKHIVWVDRFTPDEPQLWSLYTAQAGDALPTRLFSSGIPDVETESPAGIDVSNGLVVIMLGNIPKMWLLDLDDPTWSSLISVGPGDRHPTTDGRYVIWEDHNHPDDPDGRRVDLRGYDLLTNSEFIVAISGGMNLQPDLSNDWLAWLPDDGEFNGIQADPLTDRLSSAHRFDDTHGVGAYFPETGHTLNSGFLDYWETHGGLTVFGYPLTEEFLQMSRSDGDDGPEPRSTQYTERQRFEWHPENAGTPYEVLLGRLGVDLLAEQGRNWTAFLQADPAAPHYMPETGHAIDGRFHPYWSGHGLDMGDDGVSFRESLALFGYPISPAMTETNADGDTVLTQYFERAVFEWHPEYAGTPYEVLLRRLGYETLVAQGWITEASIIAADR